MPGEASFQLKLITESGGRQRLYLARGPGKARIPITDVTRMYISAHPYHSANDVSYGYNAQLMQNQADGMLYVTVSRFRDGPGASNETATDYFRIDQITDTATAIPADSFDAISDTIVLDTLFN
ncbi:MAG: hypothetical protein KDK27_01080 [Leptospiraceae bacterium]|nr:hypothetical protein [Leptospiraceae bacterium]